MATILQCLHELSERAAADSLPEIDLLSPDEARLLFDRRARQLLSISAEEFFRRWDAGVYLPVPDTVEGRKVGELVMMLPFVCRTNS